MSLPVAILVAAALVWSVHAFNRLVRMRNQVRTAWAEVDVQLLRRHDLVPPLVAAVQAYASHEREALQLVTGLRARAMAQQDPARLGEVESALQAAISRLIALKEDYPNLKASGNFVQLQRDLVGVEEHLQHARRFYNGAVRDYNDGVQRAPDLLVARTAGFRIAEFFQSQDAQRAAARVQL